MILSIIIGLAAGFVAVIIKNSVHFIRSFLHNWTNTDQQYYLYLAFPMIGVLLVILFIKYFIKQPVRHGIPNVLYRISKSNGRIKAHNMYSSIITSALTVGFGGSVGLEGPTVATSASIGSNIGRLFHMNYKQIILLLGCACSAAMAAIFKAPIAAIVFSLEVIMLDLTMASLIPLLLASASAVLTSYFFLGQDVLYPFDVEGTFQMANLPYYISLGIIAGLFSSYFTRIYVYIEKLFSKIKGDYKKLITGGLILGVLIFFIPSLYGEGYETINSCLSGDYSYLFNNSLFYSYKDSLIVAIILLFSLVLFKVVATSVTFGSGGVGGIFAPTLFIGSNLGLLTALVFKQIGFNNISTNNFALMGMAGMLAGVLHAPLTGIFLIAEITGGYQLFIPLMITATFSYATVKIFETNSVYTIQLARRKELITHDKDKAILSLLKIDKLIETNFNTIEIDKTLGDLVKVISKSQRNIFPVIDENDIFMGVVFVNDIRNIIFKPELYDSTYVRDMMFMPTGIVHPEDSMEDIAQKFHFTGNFNLPVIKDGKYLGFVSRAKVFSAYRRMLKHFSED
ncbi:MAG: chloride channel protein [Bacteroidales bacterium]|nr:chloride channel protein [Bacteroidales bacterium]